MVKKIILVIAVLFPVFKISFSKSIILTDTTSLSTQAKLLKPVKIGPEHFILPVIKPVDSVLLRKLAIDESYKKKISEESSIKHYRDAQVLNLLLSNTELYTEPTKKNLANLSSLFYSFGYAEDVKNQILVSNTLGVYHVKSGDPEKAVTYFLQSLQLQEKLKNKQAIALLTTNLAGIFKLIGKYDQAIIQYEYAGKVNSELKKTAEVAATFMNIGSVKSLQKKYSEAEYYILRKALPLFRGNKAGRMLCFEKLAEIYMAQNRFSEAKWYFLQENQIANFLNDQEFQVSSLVNLAQVKNILGDYTQALHDFKQAELLASQNKYIARLTQIKGDMGGIYLKMGDYPAAGTAIDEYGQLKKALFSIAR